MTKNDIQNRINKLRQTLKSSHIDALIVPTADPHLSEYLPEYWQAREWLTGFTGSVGTLVVTQDFAGLWTDSRYWVQGADQLTDTGISLQKMQRGSPSYSDWLVANLPTGSHVTIDGNVLSLSAYEQLLDAFEIEDDEGEDNEDGSVNDNINDNINDNVKIQLITDQDILSKLWQDRPGLPKAKLYAHEAQFVSQSAKDKLTAVRQQVAEHGATHHLISSLDDTAWLTNLRGNDVDYNPVFLAHMLITQDNAVLYVDNKKINDDIAELLNEAGITTAPYEAIQSDLATLSASDILLLDPTKVAMGTLKELNDDVAILESIAPSTFLKSIKSAQDIEHIREAMRQDGAALCEFFSELERRLANGERLSELDVDSMLIDVRSKQPHYVSPSFPTIAGYNQNGALPHYRALEDNFSYLDVADDNYNNIDNIEGNDTRQKGEGGLLLIDSGGQYQNGTTDITRVVGVGMIKDEQKRDFTLVLKAHIALARLNFPDGIASPLLDTVCRAPLWQHQLDYGHGTGHGVGYFLNVHEGPQGISYSAAPTPERAMKAGMVTSNEPGLYREGKWGIRIENLVVTQRVAKPTETEFGEYLHFETVTLCPIDTRLIDPSLLDKNEIDWLNGYHKQVFDKINDRVSGKALQWLTERTKAI